MENYCCYNCEYEKPIEKDSWFYKCCCPESRYSGLVITDQRFCVCEKHSSGLVPMQKADGRFPIYSTSTLHLKKYNDIL